MKALLSQIISLIINPIIVLGFVIATIYFFLGVIKFIGSADNEGERGKNKDNLVYGILGLFIMFSVFGILRVILNTFGICTPGKIFFC